MQSRLGLNYHHSVITKNVVHGQMFSNSRNLPFYKLLEHLERSKQWSEKEVLSRLAIPRTTYRSWRDGTSEPSKRIYWIKLSEVFGVSIEALIRLDFDLISTRRL